ncbi:hypothetical protein DDE84_07635 [Bifidobacterium tibiigranuli]|uniref:Uncharacterized protein n=1 Tax=Bifidobacterium tibiigranuli TaxID=2172043 RepID=A0A5N6RX74_9BIFI|nr:hypothetical protein DDF78_09500 [Bifidobacterium tibiigranuli]KAE8127774.1 hypothetical protein DDE84_07635 [Bifidobacterium tibiigranuli]
MPLIYAPLRPRVCKGVGSACKALPLACAAMQRSMAVDRQQQTARVRILLGLQPGARIAAAATALRLRMSAHVRMNGGCRN